MILSCFSDFWHYRPYVLQQFQFLILIQGRNKGRLALDHKTTVHDKYRNTLGLLLQNDHTTIHVQSGLYQGIIQLHVDTSLRKIKDRYRDN